MKREKGTGSLYQASDKSWVYQYKSDGKRKTKRFRLKAEAKAFIYALDKENDRISVARAGKKNPQGEVVTVGERLDRWLEKYAKPSVKLGHGIFHKGKNFPFFSGPHYRNVCLVVSV